MDPTKSFDHLDPKLKETYARVMGTQTNPSDNAVQSPTDQPAPADPALSSSPPPAFDPSQIATDPNQFSDSPLDQTTNQPQDANVGPNPGTGPTINALPDDTAAMYSSPPAETASPTGQAQDSSAPSNASFFSNPSPATSEPAPAVTNDLSTPLGNPAEAQPAAPAPYTPGDFGANQAAAAEPMTQPLPSPSTVNSGPRETSPLLRVLYIVGAVIFFLIYTFFWIKVFGLPIPFLNL